MNISSGHNFINRPRTAILLLCVALLCTACTQKKGTFTLLFNAYNLFNLHGTDTIKGTPGQTYIQVKYADSTPVAVTYKTPDNTICLTLEDSFKTEKQQPVYIYSTENLHGGSTGRQYNHSWGFEANKYLLYIALNDTIVCKNYNMLDTTDHSFLLNLYIQQQNSVINFGGPAGESNNANTSSKNSVYRQYINLLNSSFTQSPESASIESNLLPYPKEVFFYGHYKPNVNKPH